MKNVLIYYVLTFSVGLLLFFVFKPSVSQYQQTRFSVTIPKYGSDIYIDRFYDDNLKGQINLAGNLANGTPVVFGSSELTSGHLQAVPYRYFTEIKHKKIFAFGHAGFQNMAILTVLAANKAVLKNSRLLIVLSPGWFEGTYAKGTSLASFFEFCPESYLYTIYGDTTIDTETKKHISLYINEQYEKIAAPGSVHRIYAHRANKLKLFHKPFVRINKVAMERTAKITNGLMYQQMILSAIRKINPAKTQPQCFTENWDSLFDVSRLNFKSISTNNPYSVSDAYYSQYMSQGLKKEVKPVAIGDNRELKDFEALLHFLKQNNIKPCFVIMPLNTPAHDDLEKLEPTIAIVKKLLDDGNYANLDMFTPNMRNYEIGVLEDVMHPYDYGWYQIDKFMAEHLFCR